MRPFVVVALGLAVALVLVVSFPVDAQSDLPWSSGGGGGQSTDAQTLDGVDSTGFCRLVNTDGLLCMFDNTDGTADVTAATNDILEIRTSGTGSVLLSTDFVGFGDEGGTPRGYIIPSSSGISFYHTGLDTIFLLDGANEGAWVGDRNAQTASELVGGFADVISASAYTRTPLLSVYGSGLVETPAAAVQTCNCGTTGTPNTVTCDIQARVVLLTDGDADSCTVTVATTTADAINGYLPDVKIVVDSVGGGGTFDLADQAGVLEMTGAYSMGVNDTLVISYYAGALDAWQEESRSNL